MFKTLKNAWKIPELKKKLLFTLLIIVLYRLGANIPVPYVSPDTFTQVADIFKGNILQFLNILSGEALGKATLLALGVSPYITASIVVQLLTVVFTKLQEWSKDEEGKKKINMLTRGFTVGLALITSIGYAFFLEANDLLVGEPGFFQYMVIVSCYCAGAALVMWLAEQINASGIGNGISIILFANIIAGAYSLIMSLWNVAVPNGAFNVGGFFLALGQLLLLLAMLVLIVWMSDAERRIPIQYAKRVVGRKMYGGQNSNLPIKVNMSGVMPIIFANSIVSIPATLQSIWPRVGLINTLANGYFNYTKPLYVLLSVILLFAFAYFYILISFNPVEVANNIRNNGGAVPGIRPGKPTSDYIRKILNRITFIGAVFLCIVSELPKVIVAIFSLFVDINSIHTGFAKWVVDFYNTGSYYNIYGQATHVFMTIAFSGTSVLIVVGVILETVRELEAQLTMRNYKGFLD